MGTLPEAFASDVPGVELAALYPGCSNHTFMLTSPSELEGL